MRGLRFGLSLKKWPARKASGQERHPFDSAEPIAYTKTWMFCWLIPWRYRMFQTLWLDYNHKRPLIGTRVVWNNRSTLHVVFVFAFWNRIGTEDLDQAISEVIGTFDGVEEISVGLRDCNYIQRIDRLWKITAVPVTTWHMKCIKGQRVDYDWANVHYFCCLFHTERSWHAYWFSAVYFWSAWFSLWCESRAFSLTSLKRKLLRFAPCKGIHDSPGFWIPPCGFRIPCTGFRISVQ